ncbi:MAG: DUF2877 domain-containing protein [Rhodospirillaceae bacterium]|nr:DUF2877 domain-containing protein [Rhodospirillaceae bacterium]MBT7487192.1 DUF2877 domain-containing protein [Rhodospirillales bacterium]MBT4700512.1 DUF2877 domain-containing protein [Rhodospirillaceae bacterium]MBT5033545.1 DUF2877 domain-containing protein [Rhodospirillaceae bacterium]MBT6219442.1 DUF2877 domain-containing protein [Rhodospirillaceae bacterium]
MMRLAARSVGSEAPSSAADGIVCGVFDRTCNIQLTDGSLLTCATSDYFDMPRGVRVREANGFKFNAVIPGGAAANLRGGILRFAGSGLAIDLRGAHVWTQKFKPVSRPSVRDILAFGFEVGPFSERDSEFSVRDLIGRGPGLTPEGDDTLTGLLAAPMLVAPDRPESQALSRDVLSHLHATNDISRQMLFDAAQGLFIEPIISMLSALYGQGCVQKSSQNLRAVGESSGPAMLLGILAGVADVENFNLQRQAA